MISPNFYRKERLEQEAKLGAERFDEVKIFMHILRNH